MDSIDLEVLKTSAAWIASGRRCELITVIKTWGSSPRPIGATLAICEDGTVIGSVSGGCIEDDLIARVRDEGIRRTTPEIVSYGITADEAHRFGLPAAAPLNCRSNRCRSTAASPNCWNGWNGMNWCSAGSTCTAAKWNCRPRRARSCRSASSHGDHSRPALALADYRRGPVVALPRANCAGDGLQRDRLRSARRISRRLARDGVQLVHEMPDDVVIDMKLDSRSAVVALTHDPKLDDLALMEALKSNAFYVGAIGSRLNNSKRRERLVEFDLTPEQLARLHGPIGLYIGSKTPSEIAISILAEMTAIKNGVPTEMIVPHAAAPTKPGDAACVVEIGAI
jgi:xanthine dehydrogenase accessory factor